MSNNVRVGRIYLLHGLAGLVVPWLVIAFVTTALALLVAVVVTLFSRNALAIVLSGTIAIASFGLLATIVEQSLGTVQDIWLSIARPRLRFLLLRPFAAERDRAIHTTIATALAMFGRVELAAPRAGVLRGLPTTRFSARIQPHLLSDDQWQDWVRRQIASADVVVFDASEGGGPGVQMEEAMIRDANLDRSRLLVIAAGNEQREALTDLVPAFEVVRYRVGAIGILRCAFAICVWLSGAVAKEKM